MKQRSRTFFPCGGEPAGGLHGDERLPGARAALDEDAVVLEDAVEHVELRRVEAEAPLLGLLRAHPEAEGGDPGLAPEPVERLDPVAPGRPRRAGAPAPGRRAARPSGRAARPCR